MYKKINSQASALINSIALFDNLSFGKLQENQSLCQTLADFRFASLGVNKSNIADAFRKFWNMIGQETINYLLTIGVTPEVKELCDGSLCTKVEVNDLVVKVLRPQQKYDQTYLDVSLSELLDQLRQVD